MGLEGYKPDFASRKMYAKYAQLITFKARFFARNIRPSDQTIVELLSGPGANLDVMQSFGVLKGKRVVCIDLDRESLESCRQKGYEVINCDVNKMSLPNESVDVVLCNSFHHIPSQAENVIRNKVLPCLKKGGRLIGVEADGILPSFIVWIIGHLPRVMIDRSLLLREIFNERRELALFLQSPFRAKLEAMGVSQVQIKKTPFYIYYMLEK